MNWAGLATAVDTLVVLMGVKSLPRVTVQLLLVGRAPETPVALIRWGTTEQQETLIGTLANIAHKAYATKLEPPVVAVIGNVVTLSDHLHWFAESSPSFASLLQSLTPESPALL